MMTISTGTVLNNRYRIVKLLGQGGFGAVYRAWDLTLKKPCAVKQNFETSPQAHKQFEKEALILARLHHPNLPRVIDHFTLPDQGQCLIMDYVEGEDLQEKINQQDTAIPVEKAVAWIEQICDALDYLHNQNPPIIHRDIKPANIKITPEDRAVLVDFGIHKVYDPKLKTTMGARAITQGYSPPEQYGRGNTDARTDIYALGATLYSLLTGVEPPDSIDLVTGRQPSPVPSTTLNPNVPPALQAAIARATQLDPDRRFSSVRDFKAALAARKPVITSAAFSQPAQTQVANFSGIDSQAVPVHTQGKVQRNRWVLGIAAIIVLLLSYVIFLRGCENGETEIPHTQTALAVMQTQTAMAISYLLSTTPLPDITGAPSPEKEETNTPSPPTSTPIPPTNTPLPSLTSSSTPAIPSWSTSVTGEESCHLILGISVTAGLNARLWSLPDAKAAGTHDYDVGVGEILIVLDGPEWGIVRVTDNFPGWWWKVSIESSSQEGWIWEDRIQECVNQ